MNGGKAIKEIRRSRLGLNQEAFAKKAGISQTYLSQLENNKKQPSSSVLERIAACAGIPLPILFWFTISEEDVPESKIEAYRMLKPNIDQMIKSIFECAL